jgi:hypothetical protein
VTANRTRKSAEKATAKKTATKKSAAKKTAGYDQPARRRATAPRAESKPRVSAMEVAERAAEQLGRLTGKHVEGVTGVERSDDGWRVTSEVLEVRRIPETTDVLAEYQIDADDKGDLTGYRRARRYTRGSARED